MNRLAAVNKQFSPSKPLRTEETITVDGKSYPEIIDHHSDRQTKINFFNKFGWGYNDSGFELAKMSNGEKGIRIKGDRYMFGGQFLPKFLPYTMSQLHLNPDNEDPPQEDMEVAPPNLNHAFLEELGETNFSRRSFRKWERIMHSHGACLQEVWQLRYTKIDKVADVVIYPNSTEDC